MTQYKYYETHGGSMIPQSEWNHYYKEAKTYLNYFQRIYQFSVPEGQDPEDTEDQCICAVADLLKTQDIMIGQELQPVKGVKIGTVSVDYGETSALDLTEAGRVSSIYKTIKRYYPIYRGMRFRSSKCHYRGGALC